MSNRLSKQHFWEWFERHNTDYFQFHKRSEKEYKYLMNELNAHLRVHGRYMKYGLECQVEEECGILTITSLGNSKYFEKIDAFVAKAPVIANWNIQALELPQSIGYLLEEYFRNTGIDSNEFCFVPDGTEEQLFDVVVYHPLYTGERYDIFKQVAKAAIYNILGERSFGLDIGWIDVDNASCAPESSELIQLEELPGYLGGRNSSLMVDVFGNIQESRRISL